MKTYCFKLEIECVEEAENEQEGRLAAAQYVIDKGVSDLAERLELQFVELENGECIYDSGEVPDEQ